MLWIEKTAQNNGPQVFLGNGKVFLKFETYSLFKNREILKDREFYIEFNRGDRKEKIYFSIFSNTEDYIRYI